MKKKLLPILIVLTMVFTIIPIPTAAAEDYTDFIESAGVRYKEPFKMIYVEGGTFTLGWTGDEDLGPPDSTPVENVTVDGFYISETEVTQALWNAVMGSNAPNATNYNRPRTGSTWYGFQQFLGRLYVLTGKVYRMATEAEWEFAAKGGNPGHSAGHDKFRYSGSDIESDVAVVGASTANVKTKAPNILGIYDMSGNVEELVWNAWSSWHVGGTNPVGIASNVHAQRTRRGGPHAGESYTRYATARQIRSIDGSDGYLGLRIVLSEDQTSVPTGMVKPFDVRHPVNDDRLVTNSYRDPRWVTGDNYVLAGDFVGIFGGASLKLWETGEIVLRPRNDNADIPDDPVDIIGQWYTVNNMLLVLIPNEGSNAWENGRRILIPYMWMDPNMVVTNNDRLGRFMAPTGRMERQLEANLKSAIEGDPSGPWAGEYALIDKPVVPGLIPTDEISTENIAAANHQLWDMDNIPEEAKTQDPRLLDGPDHGWWMGYGAGGEHTYRKDFDVEQARFVVYSPAFGTPAGTGGANPLFRGTWYTINDCLLVVEATSYGRTTRHHYMYDLVDEQRYIAAGYEGGYENQFAKDNYPFRHLTWQDYEKGDSRLFFLEKNENVVRNGPNGMDHNYDIAIGTATLMGSTTFRQAPAAATTCPGIPGPNGTRIQCGKTVYDCTCKVFCIDHQIHDDCSISEFKYVLAADKSSYKIGDKATISVYLTTKSQKQVTSFDFVLSYDNSILTYDAADGLSGYSSNANNSVVAFTRAGGAEAIPEEGLLVATIRFTVIGTGETALSIAQGATASSSLAPMPGDKNPASPGNTVVINTNVVDGKVRFIENSVYNAAPDGYKILVLELNSDAIENATYRFGTKTLLWSIKYNAYVAMVEDTLTIADALAGVNVVIDADGSKNYALTYSGDIITTNNGSGYPVNASDAQAIYALYMGNTYFGFEQMSEMARFEADVNGDGVVNLVDVKVVQIIALALVTGG